MTTQFSESKIDVNREFPGAKKIYVPGTIHSHLRVPMRAVRLSQKQDLALQSDVVMYDSSGSFTDPQIDCRSLSGLPRIREGWITERNDSEISASQAHSSGHAR